MLSLLIRSGALCALFLAGIGFSIAADAPPRKVAAALSAEQAAREIRILERAFQDLHPGLLRYQTPERLEAEFARARAAVTEGASTGEMYLLATRLGAALRCGHTWTNPVNQSPRSKAMLGELLALPFRVRVLQGRWVVMASADPRIRRHDEILAVDGRPVATIGTELLPYLRADGSSDGKRWAQLTHDDQGGALDRLLPLLYPPVAGRYALRMRSPDGPERTIEVTGQRAATRDAAIAAAGVAPEDYRWRLESHGDIAIMTLPTFAFWNSGFDGRAWFEDAFRRLERERVRTLVLDLRQNEGGDSALGRALMGYLLEHAHTPPPPRVESAYERVPYPLARYLETWDFSFFDRTGQVRRGPGRNWLLLEQPGPGAIIPSQPRFSGRVVALVGPRMSSAGFILARDLKAAGRATLIGEPTGGNRRGLNGGQIAWLTLPHSGVAIDIPLLASIHEDQPDQPVVPDREVRTSVEDVIRGRDPVMEAAIEAHRAARDEHSRARASTAPSGTEDEASP
jgi:hypothetical protein